jgi:ribosomal protein L24E
MIERKIEGDNVGTEITECPYCGKPIETPVRRRIFARPDRGTMTFCSEDCGAYYQMGCEG